MTERGGDRGRGRVQKKSSDLFRVPVSLHLSVMAAVDSIAAEFSDLESSPAGARILSSRNSGPALSHFCRLTAQPTLRERAINTHYKNCAWQTEKEPRRHAGLRPANPQLRTSSGGQTNFRLCAKNGYRRERIIRLQVSFPPPFAEARATITRRITFWGQRDLANKSP